MPPGRNQATYLPSGDQTGLLFAASKLSWVVTPAAGNNDVAASYWFYGYNADGTFASRASVMDKIVLGAKGQFTSSGMVVDYDANGRPAASRTPLRA